MPTKRLFLDLETTGSSSYKHGIHQIAYIIDIDGQVVSTTEINCTVTAPKLVDVELMKRQGIDYQMLAEEKSGRISSRFAFQRMRGELYAYVDRYNPSDKFHLIGYNIKFDSDFLRQLWKDNHDDFFGSLFWNPAIDVMSLLAEELISERRELENFKLGTVARYLKGDEWTEAQNWHDAMTDIQATRQLYYERRGGMPEVSHVGRPRKPKKEDESLQDNGAGT